MKQYTTDELIGHIEQQLKEFSALTDETINYRLMMCIKELPAEKFETFTTEFTEYTSSKMMLNPDIDQFAAALLFLIENNYGYPEDISELWTASLLAIKTINTLSTVRQKLVDAAESSYGEPCMFTADEYNALGEAQTEYISKSMVDITLKYYDQVPGLYNILESASGVESIDSILSTIESNTSLEA